GEEAEQRREKPRRRHQRGGAGGDVVLRSQCAAHVFAAARVGVYAGQCAIGLRTALSRALAQPAGAGAPAEIFRRAIEAAVGETVERDLRRGDAPAFGKVVFEGGAGSAVQFDQRVLRGERLCAKRAADLRVAERETGRAAIWTFAAQFEAVPHHFAVDAGA